MRILWPVAAVFALTLLAGCGAGARLAGDPSATSPESPTPDDTEGGQRVALCYNGNATTQDALIAAARDLCKEPGSTVTYWSSDWNLNNCPLLKKRRVTFICHPPK